MATPRKMKPMPIQIASNRMDSCRLRKHSTANTSAAAPLMNNSTRPPAETCNVKAKTTCATPLTSRYTPKMMAATRIVVPGQASTNTPRMTAATPDNRVVFHRCGNNAGTVVDPVTALDPAVEPGRTTSVESLLCAMAEVWHTGGFVGRICESVHWVVKTPLNVRVGPPTRARAYRWVHRRAATGRRSGWTSRRR